MEVDDAADATINEFVKFDVDATINEFVKSAFDGDGDNINIMETADTVNYEYTYVPDKSINNLTSEADIDNYIGTPPIIIYSNKKQVSPNFLNSFLISCHGTSLTDSSFRKIIIPQFIDMYFHARNGYQCSNSFDQDNPTKFFTNDFNSIIRSFVNDTLYTEKHTNFIYWINKRSGGDVINDCYLRSENDLGMRRSVLLGTTYG
jgi:hypothetical protein